VVETRSRSFVSAQQVADHAGVSRSAVSRTFTTGASVSEATRRKVLRAADELGYHVNHLARSLIQEQSGIVCLIVADVATPYQSRMLDALSRRLQGFDRVAMVINTSGESGSVEAALRQTLNYRAAATVVLSGAPPAALITTCLNSGQRMVLINRDDHLAGPVNVSVDNAEAAREALHMLHRCGCRRVAVVSSTAGTPSLVARERAFAAAAAERGIEPAVVRAGPTSYSAGFDAGRLLLSGSAPPDAAFCVTDLLACGFMDAARREFGLRIPDDLCVIGFDDIEQAGWASFDLTTFRQPVDAMADHIMRLVTDPDAAGAGDRRFHAAPVWRRSVRPR
jgi:DNA-binding LacI/PurR family transcriptional regulator